MLATLYEVSHESLH